MNRKKSAHTCNARFTPPARCIQCRAREQFLHNLLDPEMYGHAVTAEVRDEARLLLGMPAVETHGGSKK